MQIAARNQTALFTGRSESPSTLVRWVSCRFRLGLALAIAAVWLTPRAALDRFRLATDPPFRGLIIAMLPRAPQAASERHRSSRSSPKSAVPTSTPHPPVRGRDQLFWSIVAVPRCLTSCWRTRVPHGTGSKIKIRNCPQCFGTVSGFGQTEPHGALRSS
jgi:hypothetical protein